jgi:hypothetical protein
MARCAQLNVQVPRGPRRGEPLTVVRCGKLCESFEVHGVKSFKVGVNAQRVVFVRKRFSFYFHTS